MSGDCRIYRQYKSSHAKILTLTGTTKSKWSLNEDIGAWCTMHLLFFMYHNPVNVTRRLHYVAFAFAILYLTLWYMFVIHMICTLCCFFLKESDPNLSCMRQRPPIFAAAVSTTHTHKDNDLFCFPISTKKRS